MEYTQLHTEPKRASIGIELVLPTLFVLVLAAIFGFGIYTDTPLDWLGVQPREIPGLLGILGMPLVHGSLEHLANNSVPLLILSWALTHFYKKVAWKVFVRSWLVTGALVWLAARSGTTHIGASGIVYALASFVFFSGIIRRSRNLIALSLIVVVQYGGMVWGVFPIEPGISWEGHLFGALTGLGLAVYYRKYGPQREVHLYDRPEYTEADDEVPWDDWKLIPDSEEPRQRRVVVRYVYRQRPRRPQAKPNTNGQNSGSLEGDSSTER